MSLQSEQLTPKEEEQLMPYLCPYCGCRYSCLLYTSLMGAIENDGGEPLDVAHSWMNSHEELINGWVNN